MPFYENTNLTPQGLPTSISDPRGAHTEPRYDIAQLEVDQSISVPVGIYLVFENF